MISPFVLVAIYSFRMVVRPLPKTDCVGTKAMNHKGIFYVSAHDIYPTVSERACQTKRYTYKHTRRNSPIS